MDFTLCNNTQINTEVTLEYKSSYNWLNQKNHDRLEMFLGNAVA